MNQYEVTDELGNHIKNVEARCIEDVEFDESVISATKPVLIKKV